MELYPNYLLLASCSVAHFILDIKDTLEVLCEAEEKTEKKTSHGIHNSHGPVAEMALASLNCCILINHNMVAPLQSPINWELREIGAKIGENDGPSLLSLWSEDPVCL